MLKANMPAVARGCMAALCAAAVGFAHGAVIEQYDGMFDVSTTVSNGNGTAVTDADNLSYSLTFSLFDGSLGTLTGVSITYQGSLDTTYTVARNNAGPNAAQQITMAIDRSAGFALTGGGTLGSESDSFSTTYSLAKNASQTDVDHPFGILLVDGTWNAAAEDLAAFVGAGSFAVDAFAALSQTLSGPNGTMLLSSAHWWGNAALVYTFTPFANGGGPGTEPQQTAVPEPSALLLAGIGLLALALHTRRRV